MHAVIDILTWAWKRDYIYENYVECFENTDKVCMAKNE